MSTNREINSFKLEDQTSRCGGTKIWTLTFDMQGEKVNKLSKKIASEVDALLPQLETLGAERKIDALILISGKPGNFIAGADIEMIRATKTSKEAEELSREGQKLMNRWEDLPFPTVAGIHGAALGGGFEFALACSAIVMSDHPSAKIGLPEVMLGLVPGSGGTIRLPRKAGLATALDMILTGRNFSGDKALKLGLIEGYLPKENFEESVLRWTQTQLSALKSQKRIAKEPKLGGMGGPAGGFLEKNILMRSLIFKKARDGVLSKTHGHYPAPLEALDVIQSTGGGYGDRLRGKARTQALAKEATAFGKLAATEVSKNLIRLFFLTEGVKKSQGLPNGRTVKERPVNTAGVLGAGVMGGGIAQLFADKGIQARMKDLNSEALSLGIQSAAKIFQKQVQRKKITKRQYLQKLNYIAPVLDYSGFHHLDLVVEAIVENIDVKKKVFTELENQIKPDCIVASNTSSLSVSKMQTSLQKPERFVGMHFFNPVSKMPLVEVIRGEKTSDESVSAVFQLCKKLGKTPIVVKDAPGFLVNRLLMTYLNEAVYLAVEGVPIPELDKVLVNFGMPMGPMELIDEVGVDVGEKVSHILHDAFGARMEPAPENSRISASGRLGKKTGKGLYEYEGPQKTKVFNPQIYEILGIKEAPHKLAEEEILERCILPMINEASRCLEEGIVSSPEEVDLGMIMGTGFPPFRGGLLRYADSLGAGTLVNRLKHYETKFGERFRPSKSLVARAENEQKFYSS
ncbi:MAG: 3-hydroxyacyl-CoA dehydrogenase NAD-binding domain-containing protein [Bdellovibrionia bacterium]